MPRFVRVLVAVLVAAFMVGGTVGSVCIGPIGWAIACVLCMTGFVASLLLEVTSY